MPLDWDRPGGRSIQLAVTRHLASRPDKRIGSLFVNPGGPGGSVDEVQADPESLDAMGDGRFDVVGWDVRGAGASTRVRCFRKRAEPSELLPRLGDPDDPRGLAPLRRQDRPARRDVADGSAAA